MVAPIQPHRKGAEFYQGDVCKDVIVKILEEFKLPSGMLPADQLTEIGLNRSTGFIWMKLKKKTEHKFKKIGQTVIYAQEITGFIQPGHLTKLTGVKAKEMMIAVVVTDLLAGSPTPDMIKFTSALGLSRSHPISAFLLDPEDQQNVTVSPN